MRQPSRRREGDFAPARGLALTVLRVVPSDLGFLGAASDFFGAAFGFLGAALALEGVVVLAPDGFFAGVRGRFGGGVRRRDAISRQAAGS